MNSNNIAHGLLGRTGSAIFEKGSREVHLCCCDDKYDYYFESNSVVLLAFSFIDQLLMLDFDFTLRLNRLVDSVNLVS